MNKKLIALTFAASLFAACGNDSSSNASDSDDYKREFATSISTGETMFIGTMNCTACTPKRGQDAHKYKQNQQAASCFDAASAHPEYLRK